MDGSSARSALMAEMYRVMMSQVLTPGRVGGPRSQEGDPGDGRGAARVRRRPLHVPLPGRGYSEPGVPRAASSPHPPQAPGLGAWTPGSRVWAPR